MTSSLVQSKVSLYCLHWPSYATWHMKPLQAVTLWQPLIACMRAAQGSIIRAVPSQPKLILSWPLSAGLSLAALELHQRDLVSQFP